MHHRIDIPRAVYVIVFHDDAHFCSLIVGRPRSVYCEALEIEEGTLWEQEVKLFNILPFGLAVLRG